MCKGINSVLILYSCAKDVGRQLSRGELLEIRLTSTEGTKITLTYPPAMHDTMQRAITASRIKAVTYYGY